MQTKKLSIPVSDSIGSVSAELLGDENAEWLYVFAHGAGAGMHHPFMLKLSQALAEGGIASLRYNFPYMENSKKRPDPPAVAHLTVKRSIQFARDMRPKAMILAGGKSFGGRMTSQLMSTEDLGARGIVFVGFPLHPSGAPGVDRAAHLTDGKVPMLFLQGTRDALAELSLIEQVCSSLPLATLEKFEGADHSFKSGKKDFIPVLSDAVRSWVSTLR